MSPSRKKSSARAIRWKFVNYTPVVGFGVLSLLWLYRHDSVRKWFTGPVRQVEAPATTG